MGAIYTTSLNGWLVRIIVSDFIYILVPQTETSLACLPTRYKAEMIVASEAMRAANGIDIAPKELFAFTMNCKVLGAMSWTLVNA